MYPRHRALFLNVMDPKAMHLWFGLSAEAEDFSPREALTRVIPIFYTANRDVTGRFWWDFRRDSEGVEQFKDLMESSVRGLNAFTWGDHCYEEMQLVVVGFELVRRTNLEELLLQCFPKAIFFAEDHDKPGVVDPKPIWGTKKRYDWAMNEDMLKPLHPPAAESPASSAPTAYPGDVLGG